MREIKFRAWDKDKNIIRVVNELDFLTESIVTKPIDGTSEMWELYDHVCFKGSYELMQYTGLKDKNGVEIYEGDIVKCKIYDKKYIGLVEFSSTLAVWFMSGMQRSDTELWGCNDKEVIGNIYENKEILEEE